MAILDDGNDLTFVAARSILILNWLSDELVNSPFETPTPPSRGLVIFLSSCIPPVRLAIEARAQTAACRPPASADFVGGILPGCAEVIGLSWRAVDFRRDGGRTPIGGRDRRSLIDPRE